MLTMAGMGLGAVLSSVISDRYGRKVVQVSGGSPYRHFPSRTRCCVCSQLHGSDYSKVHFWSTAAGAKLMETMNNDDFF